MKCGRAFPSLRVSKQEIKVDRVIPGSWIKVSAPQLSFARFLTESKQSYSSVKESGNHFSH